MLLTGNASKLVALRTPYVCVKSLGCVAARNRISSRPLLATPGNSRHVHRVFGGSSSSRPLQAPASATTRGVTGVEQGTSSDSSSRPALPQQQQQQQQAAAWAQAPQWRQQAGMTGQAAPAAAANSGVAAVPSLDHPSTIPLHLEDGTVKDAAGNVLLEQLSSLASLNVRQSKHGALVFGAASQHGPACCWDVTVGKLKFKRYLACARNKLWWMTPEWGSSLHTLPPETQFLLLQLDNGSSSSGEQRYALLLPLIDGDFRGTLRPNRSWTDKEGSLCLRVESGDDTKLGESCDSVLLMACSTDPFQLVDAGVAAAAALSGGAAPRAAKQLPASLDGFGWCTWDAFYSTVSARGLVEGLGSLAAGGLSPQLLIIDDGWQLTDVDPPYGKAPTAQLADKLAGEGTAAAELFDGPREMVLETQDTFYQENAKLLAEASGQMQQEVRNLFPTVANTGVISHHHAPPAATWDAPADAVIAAKEQQIAASRDSRDGGAAAADESSGSIRPDWAEARKSAAKSTVPSERRPLLSRRQQEEDSSSSAAAGAAAGDGSADAQQQQQHPKKKKQGGVLQTSHLEDLIANPKHAAEVVEAELKAAAAEAEAALEQAKIEAELRLEAARAETNAAMKRAIQKASPTPRQQFILIRWAQKAAGALVGVATAAFLLFYQWVVEPAPPNSLRVKAFAALTQGVLRGAMLTFFASASDFTRRLTSVEANAKFARLDAGPEEDWEATPADFRGVVTHIKEKFGIRYVYCWHGLPAYWGGVMPGTPSLAGVTGSKLVYPKPTASIAEVEPSLMWSPAVLAGVGIADDPNALYSAMHTYLASSAVDGVKVDCQAGVGLVGSALGGGPSASREFQAALEDSIARHFPGNHAINCMCHSSENFYRFSRTAVARVSDDYYPRDPASSTPHIGACAFNSLYLGALVQPDWDMFQSAHPAGVLHGMARAVSGGAVYVSDKPGQHDFALLRRLVLPDGAVLRALLPGRPTRDCLFADVLRDRQSLLKVWNINPVVGIIGVFNLQGSSWDRNRRKFHVHDKRGQTLTSNIWPGDVEPMRHSAAADGAANGGDGGSSRWADAAAAAGVDGGAAPQQQQQQLYAMYRYGTEELAVVPNSGSISVALGPSGSDLVWVSALQVCGGVSFAPIGLVDMFNGGGAVTSCKLAPAHVHAQEAAAAAGNGGVLSSSRGSSSSPVVAAAAVAGSSPSAVAALQLKGCGRFLSYSSVRPSRVLLNLTPHNFSWDEFTNRLEFEVPQLEGLQCEVQVLYQ